MISVGSPLSVVAVSVAAAAGASVAAAVAAAGAALVAQALSAKSIDVLLQGAQGLSETESHEGYTVTAILSSSDKAYLKSMQGSGENPAFSREEIRTAAGYENGDEFPLGEEDGDEEDEATNSAA